ncbi:MAG: ribonuclease III, partial [Hungatella sp.]|nr:ribonuclease III [Hungatella sp.]
MSRNLKELEERIGYRFSDKRLMTQAMTHSSYANEHRLN